MQSKQETNGTKEAGQAASRTDGFAKFGNNASTGKLPVGGFSPGALKNQFSWRIDNRRPFTAETASWNPGGQPFAWAFSGPGGQMSIGRKVERGDGRVYHLMFDDDDPCSYWRLERCTFSACSPFNNRYHERLSSFGMARCPDHLVNRAKEMAYTGFSYTGNLDAVSCFACDVTVYQWEDRDDIRMEHKKWSPCCPHLRKVCPDLFNCLQL